MWQWIVTAGTWIVGKLFPKNPGGGGGASTFQFGANQSSFNQTATASQGGTAINARVVHVHSSLPQPDSRDLSEDAERLLALTLTDPQGKLTCSRDSHEFAVKAADTYLLKEKNEAEWEKWQSIIQNFVQLGYMRDKGSSGQVYSLTDRGRQKASEVTHRDPFLGLSHAAMELLGEVSEDADGMVERVQQLTDVHIYCNKQSFAGRNDPKEAALWTDAIRRLTAAGYLTEESDGKTFRITQTGLNAATRLNGG